MKKFTEIVANIREVKEPTGKLKDACWKGYTAVGMKMKNGRKVPNCVPVGEQFESDKPEPGREAVDGRFVAQPSKSVTKPAPQATPKNEEAEHLDEMPGANMDTVAVHRHLRKGGWSLTRTKGGHDVYTHPKSEKHIAVPRHRQLKAPLVRGIMKDAQVSEDVDQVEEAFNPDKKDPRGGTVFIAVNPWHGGKGKYEVTFRPNKDSARGRTKGQLVSSHQDPEEAETAKKQYAQKHGYNALKPIGEDVEHLDESPKHLLHKALVYNRGADKLKAQHERDGDTGKLIANIQKLAKSKHGMNIDSKTAKWIAKDLVHPARLHEEVDQLDEISQQTKQSYLQKAKDQVKELEPHAKSGEYRDIAKNMMNRREKGIAMATESRGHKIIATKLAQIEARRKQEQEIAKRIEQERKQNEPVKPVKEEKGSWQKETDWKKAKPEPVDKSGAKHSAMSRVKHLAKMASRKRVLEQDNDNQVDNVRTPAKQSLAFRGVVKNMAKSTKGKKLASDDKFQDEPELNTQIMRNNF